jgi:hypothetical protein
MLDTTIEPGKLPRRRPLRAVALWIAAIARPAAADIYRALLLLLLSLLGLCAGLMCHTGRYDVGSLVIGCVLLVGLGAANWAR